MTFVMRITAGNGSESMMVPETYHQSTQPDFVLTSDAGEEALIDHNMTLPEDGDSALGGSTSPEPFGKSQCSSMSDGESFECYGEGVVMDELDPESPPSRHSNISNGERERRSMSLNRNTWHRSSLRGSKSSHHDNISHRRSGSFRHSGKRLGSNALASQLYRSSSFNSSGRSSNCDTAEDIYSDISLEEDVLDLNHKVQMLQQQVNILADNQNDTDDRYTRAKQDNAALQARVLMLEEQLRDCELRSQERLDEEQRRHRELMVRVDREKQLQLENCNIRLQTLELEGASLRDETLRLHAQLEKLRCEKLMLEEKLNEADTKITVLAEENRQLQEADKRVKDDAARQRKIDFQIVEELNREVEILKAEKGEEQHQGNLDITCRLSELEAQVNTLRQENSMLKESNEELQAQLITHGVEEGRNLLSEASVSHSLAEEFEAMSHNEMRAALKEQQEVNTQLRSYIDGILLNIVENYPQLLEVKTNCTS